MNIEFQVGGKAYRADRLNVFQQLHVSRKIAPLIPALVPLFLEISKQTGASAEKGPGALIAALPKLAPLLQPFTDGLAALDDKAAEYVFATCLSVVKRQNADVWAAVWHPSAGAMFDDLNDLGVATPIVVRVIIESLGPFVRGLLTSQQETSDSPAAPAP